MPLKEVVPVQLYTIYSSIKCCRCLLLSLACPSHVFPCQVGGESWTKESCALANA